MRMIIKDSCRNMIICSKDSYITYISHTSDNNYAVTNRHDQGLVAQDYG